VINKNVSFLSGSMGGWEKEMGKVEPQNEEAPCPPSASLLLSQNGYGGRK